MPPKSPGAAGWLLAAVPVAFASVLLYGHAMLWGLGGEVQLSRYPTSWVEADDVGFTEWGLP